MEKRLVVAVKAMITRVTVTGEAPRILLVQREAQDEIGGGTWECPGGKLEFGESLWAALEREVYEETGLRVTAGSLLYAIDFMTSPERQVVLLGYRCLYQSGEVCLSKEHQAYLWGTQEDARRLLPSPLYHDLEQSGALKEIQPV